MQIKGCAAGFDSFMAQSSETTSLCWWGLMEYSVKTKRRSHPRLFIIMHYALVISSSTRRDDLLLNQETLNRMWIMRRFLGDRTSIEAMEFIKDRMERTRSNEELLLSMND